MSYTNEKPAPGYPNQQIYPAQGGQPGPTPMMSMSGGPMGGNRNALNKPFGSDGKRDWSFGLFDCFSSCGTCMFSWCCPCFQFGKNASRLDSLQKQGAPHPEGGDCCNTDCMVYGALLYCGCPCLVHMGRRKDTRERYGIEGGGGGDFLKTWCCNACALTQESRELELEEKSLMGGHQHA